MRCVVVRILACLGTASITACDGGVIAGCCRLGGGSEATGVRVVNAFNGPVDVLVDGQVVVSGLAAGAIDTLTPAAGTHALLFRSTGSATSSTQSVTTASGTLNTVAVVMAASGGVSSTVLDDTNSVVPAGRTKVRVLHLAPNAGTLQVYRTQPDFQQPVAWQFPFTYQSDPTSLSAPFYESSVGTWEVRVWQTPADATGWTAATLRVTIPLGSGEKKTVMILDKAGGGLRLELL